MENMSVEELAALLRTAILRNGKTWNETAVEILKTLDEQAEYEYAVQVHQDDPDRWVVVGRILAYGEEPYWSSKVTIEEHMERQREYWTHRTFRLIKRRKAGGIEDV